MKLSRTSAQQIVEGIGKFHPGPYEVLTNHLPELYIIRERELADDRVPCQ